MRHVSGAPNRYKTKKIFPFYLTVESVIQFTENSTAIPKDLVSVSGVLKFCDFHSRGTQRFFVFLFLFCFVLCLFVCLFFKCPSIRQ